MKSIFKNLILGVLLAVLGFTTSSGFAQTNIFPISSIVNVSVSNAPSAVNEYNTSNLAIFSTELPANSFGVLGYALYESPGQVATDFGTSSRTYQMANAIFGQNPNILLPGGQLIVISQAVASQTITFSGVAASGNFQVDWVGNTTTTIAWNAPVSTIQSALQALAPLSEVTVTGSIASQSLVVVMNGVYGATPPVFTFTSLNTLMTGGSSPITLTATNTTQGESIGAAVTRTQGLVQYFGMCTNHTLAVIGQTDLLAAAAIIQALPVIADFTSFTPADVAPGGMIDLLRTGGFTQTRGLYYQDSSSGGINAVLYGAAYLGRALSVDFSGSLTTLTMNLKQLAGINPDPHITNTIKNQAVTAGADVYINIAGSPENLSSGGNQFFDNVYNQLWLQGAIQIAGFNYLAQTSTKILQTQDGMNGLVGAYRQVLLQGVNNGYLAPGTWTSSTTFGNLTNFYNNITQYGFYIYSTPISQQSQTNRANRVAPLVQMAVKLAGAIQSSSVIVNINP